MVTKNEMTRRRCRRVSADSVNRSECFHSPRRPPHAGRPLRHSQRLGCGVGQHGVEIVDVPDAVAAAGPRVDLLAEQVAPLPVDGAGFEADEGRDAEREHRADAGHERPQRVEARGSGVGAGRVAERPDALEQHRDALQAEQQASTAASRSTRSTPGVAIRIFASKDQIHQVRSIPKVALAKSPEAAPNRQ